MSEVVQPPARIGFDWPGLDIHTLDMELMDGGPAPTDLEPFQRAWREEREGLGFIPGAI